MVYCEWQPDYHLIRERSPCIEFKKQLLDEIYDSLRPEQRNILVIDDK